MEQHSCPQQVGIRNGIAVAEQSGRGVLGVRSALQMDVSTLTSLLWAEVLSVLKEHFQFCFPCNYYNPMTHSLLALGRETKTRRCMAVASHRGLWDEFVVFLSLDLEGTSCKC